MGNLGRVLGMGDRRAVRPRGMNGSDPGVHVPKFENGYGCP